MEMISWIIGRKIDAFEEEFSYDMSYARELLAVSPKALMLFNRVRALGDYRAELPKEAWHAAKLMAIRLEDCGSCLQLAATLAARDGMRPELIAAVLNEDLGALPDELRLTVIFSKAVLERDLAADGLRRQILERFGRGGLVSLAFAIVSARMYPSLKYALGYGHACSAVQVRGQRVWPAGGLREQSAPRREEAM
jgi:hypothetical protein